MKKRMETTIFQLKKEVEEILTTNILPYWMDKMIDVQHGGFYGRINGQEVLMPEAEKESRADHRENSKIL